MSCANINEFTVDVMTGKDKLFKVSLLIVLLTSVTACGTIVTPVGRISEVTGTTETGHGEEATAISVPLTATLIPPTFTNTPEPLADTSEPTTEPTEEPTVTELDTATETTLSASEISDGERLFHQFQSHAGYACVTCHFTDSDERLIGPGLLTIAERAAIRVEGQSGEDYIRESIINPGSYLVEGYPDMFMPQNFAEIFSAEQIDYLVAYLLSLAD